MATPGIYRLSAPALVTGVKTGSLNDNITFNTNIPSLDFAIRIRRVRWWRTFSASSAFGAGAENVAPQWFTQLTENQTKTSILTSDTSYLDEDNFSLILDGEAATAASIDVFTLQFQEQIHDFPPDLTPYTVATKLNFIATMVNNGAATFPAGTVYKPIVQIEYTLERLTADLRDYLAKRLQIQGS
jgi:hypothetical protein